MTLRVALYALLLVVAAAAAVLSFAALRDLALLCGFTTGLAWLLPVVVDTGAAAGSIAWLAGWTPVPGRRYGRSLTLLLLGSSVAGNALAHALDAYRLAPTWWVVVIVSAIAPAVLGAVVHLVVLVGRPHNLAARPTTPTNPVETPEKPAGLALAPALAGEPGDDRLVKVRQLVAGGAGRATIAKELQISPHQARTLIERAKDGAA